MNARQIIDRAVLLKRMPIQDVYGLAFMDEAMNLLSLKYDSACTRKTETVVVTSNNIKDFVTITAEEGFRGVESVVLDELKVTNYLVDRNAVQFNYVGTYSVNILIKSTVTMTIPISTVTPPTPTINPAYHYALAKFIASRDLTETEPNNPKSVMLMQEFYQEADEVDSRLSNLKRKNRKIKARVWR